MDGVSRQRGVRLAEVPLLSVLVTSRVERKRLETCLDVLVPDCRSLGAQVVVVRAADPAEIGELSAAYPGVHFSAAPADTPEAELRVLGMAQVTGDIVVLRRDDPVAADWLASRIRRVQPVVAERPQA
jgi:hypothetical protein